MNDDEDDDGDHDDDHGDIGRNRTVIIELILCSWYLRLGANCNFNALVECGMRYRGTPVQ